MLELDEWIDARENENIEGIINIGRIVSVYLLKYIEC